MNKRKVVIILMCIGLLTMIGCSQKEKTTVTNDKPQTKVVTNSPTQEPTKESTQEPTQEPAKQSPSLDVSNYVGEYICSNDSSELQIAKNDDDTYKIQVDLFRLTTINGIGNLTQDGIEFIGSNPGDIPVNGVIMIKDEIATVTFTDSSMEYIDNGLSYTFDKTSDKPDFFEY